MIGGGIDDRVRARHDIGDQIAGTRSDAETVAAEAGGEDEAGQFAGFANGRHAIRRAVDEARPGGGNLGFAEGRQKLAFSRAGMGRCQGRFCGQAGQEIVAAASGISVELAGRLRGQAPVKPLPLAIVKGGDDA